MYRLCHQIGICEEHTCIKPNCRELKEFDLHVRDMVIGLTGVPDTIASLITGLSAGEYCTGHKYGCDQPLCMERYAENKKHCRMHPTYCASFREPCQAYPYLGNYCIDHYCTRCDRYKLGQCMNCMCKYEDCTEKREYGVTGCTIHNCETELCPRLKIPRSDTHCMTCAGDLSTFKCETTYYGGECKSLTPGGPCPDHICKKRGCGRCVWVKRGHSQDFCFNHRNRCYIRGCSGRARNKYCNDCRCNGKYHGKTERFKKGKYCNICFNRMVAELR